MAHKIFPSIIINHIRLAVFTILLILSACTGAPPDNLEGSRPNIE